MLVMGDKFLICRNITNKAPVAVCQNINRATRRSRKCVLAAADVDNGSTAAEGA
jgi:hypothetical protein